METLKSKVINTERQVVIFIILGKHFKPGPQDGKITWFLLWPDSGVESWGYEDKQHFFKQSRFQFKICTAGWSLPALPFRMVIFYLLGFRHKYWKASDKPGCVLGSAGKRCNAVCRKKGNVKGICKGDILMTFPAISHKGLVSSFLSLPHSRTNLSNVSLTQAIVRSCLQRECTTHLRHNGVSIHIYLFESLSPVKSAGRQIWLRDSSQR